MCTWGISDLWRGSVRSVSRIIMWLEIALKTEQDKASIQLIEARRRSHHDLKIKTLKSSPKL